MVSHVDFITFPRLQSRALFDILRYVSCLNIMLRIILSYYHTTLYCCLYVWMIILNRYAYVSLYSLASVAVAPCKQTASPANHQKTIDRTITTLHLAWMVLRLCLWVVSKTRRNSQALGRLVSFGYATRRHLRKGQLSQAELLWRSLKTPSPV